jgi:hypothetical protein
MSELSSKQARHTKNISRLVLHMIEKGYEPRFAPDHCNHMTGSLHYIGLAKDINLFKNGVFLTKTEDHKEFGDYWKTLDTENCWGGDFTNKDGCHYSIKYGGKK